MENDKGLGGTEALSWKGVTGRFTECWAPSAELLREWNSSHPIVDAFATSTIVVVSTVVIAIAPAPIVVAAVTAVVSETVDVADEAQLALNLRPL
jgi:hypothetical protein